MTPILIAAIVCIVLALACYTTGVWWEHKDRMLYVKHVVFFVVGLCFDIIGTTMMTTLRESSEGNAILSAHAITGWIAIVLMILHAIWAIAVVIQKEEKLQENFHKFSIIVWGIWLIPFVIGMFMGMRR